MSVGLGKPQSWAQSPSLGQGQHFSAEQGAGIFVLVEQGVAGLSPCGLQLLGAADAQALGVPREQLEGKAGRKTPGDPRVQYRRGRLAM